MCGIAGAFEFDAGGETDRDLLRAMCDAMARRGPDDQGMFTDGPAAIAMRRLAIIDVAGGQQPIANEDGDLHIVFNGEIFNHREIAAGLLQRGHTFRSHSDTEAILHLFEEEGPACLTPLRGMFAIAIWDRRRRTLFIARDRLGIKPLHYYCDDHRFVFASDLPALLCHPAVPREVDWTAIDAFFTYGYIPAPLTAYKHVRKLEPAHYLTVDRQGLRATQYWDLTFEPKLRGTDRELGDEFIARFEESVKMRLLSEVPLGAFLSGGVDSSLLVSSMARASARPVKTFTIGFNGTGTLDERSFAREVSQRYHTDHVEYEVEPEVDTALQTAVQAFGEPFADDSIVPTNHICRLAKEEVTVVLTGLGGDENFAGYERYLGLKLSDRASAAPWRYLTGFVRPVVGRLREQRSGHYRVNHAKRFLDGLDLPPASRWQRYSALFTAAERRQLYVKEIASEVDFDAVDEMGAKYFRRAEAEHNLDRAIYQDLKMYLADDLLALSDRVGMWHSLELRVPFIDHTLVEFCARLPIDMKIRHLTKKYLLREAARRFVPPSVLNHRKQGFASPMASWLRGALKPLVGRVLDRSALAAGGTLMPDVVARYIAQHDARQALNDRRIFAMLMFQLWQGDATVGGPTRGLQGSPRMTTA